MIEERNNNDILKVISVFFKSEEWLSCEARPFSKYTAEPTLLCKRLNGNHRDRFLIETAIRVKQPVPMIGKRNNNDILRVNVFWHTFDNAHITLYSSPSNFIIST